MNILDIGLITPPSAVNVGKKITINQFCISSPFTGIRAPLPSLPNAGELILIPHVKVNYNAPWFNAGNQQMFLKGTGFTREEENEPEKTGRTANFRIIYHNAAVASNWLILLPFLFSAFTTQLQWFILTADTCKPATMVTAVLLIQSLVNNQKAYVGVKTVATDVLAVTYCLTAVYVVTVALMTFINITKDTGRIEFLAHYQGGIFSYLRFIGLLCTPLFIPLLVFKSDLQTGQQQRIDWLWPLVISFCFLVFAIKVAWGIKTQMAHRKKKRAEEEAKKAKMEEEEGETVVNYGTKVVRSMTADEIKKWIMETPELQLASRLTKDELAKVQHKFLNASIDGPALLRIGSDPEQIVKYVEGVPFGQALAFCDALAALKEEGIVKFDLDPRSHRLMNMNKVMKASRSMSLED